MFHSFFVGHYWREKAKTFGISKFDNPQLLEDGAPVRVRVQLLEKLPQLWFMVDITTM